MSSLRHRGGDLYPGEAFTPPVAIRPFSLPAFILNFAAGCLMPFAFAPYDQQWLAPLALVIWLGLLLRTHAPFRLSFAFGLGWFGFGSWWLAVTFHHYGHLPWSAAIAFQLLAGVVLAIYPALWGWLARKLSRQDTLALLIIFPLLAVPEEWLRGHLFTGLPWTELGILTLNTPWIGWGSVVGGLGLSLIPALLAATLVTGAIAWQQRALRAPALVMGLLCLLIAVTAPTPDTPTSPPIQVTLVQPNVSQDAKWDRTRLTTIMQRLVTLSSGIKSGAGKSDLIVWPEAATPFFLSHAPGWRQWLRKQVEHWHTPLLFGGLRQMEDGTASNGAWLLVPGQQSIPFVGKHHLVPFGEYVPSWVPWLHKLVPDIGNFQPAHDSGVVTVPRGTTPLKIATLICYESIFSDEMRTRILHGANLIAVLTNDAWYDRTPASWEHLQASQMRAVESDRFVLRAANTGVSAIIAPDGTIRTTIPWWQQGVVRGVVHPISTITPYVHFGDWPMLLFSLLAIVFLCTRLTVKFRTTEGILP
ncbi:MAG: apolipoprotein N-acyltransferase [Mariprofundales bacterium]|nr:apolipoprotein N-acyltransferase [Mariprofundales bacterium]